MSSKSGKKLTKQEELLLQDFSRNVSTKSSALFYGNAVIVSIIPICKLQLFLPRQRMWVKCERERERERERENVYLPQTDK